MARSAGSGCRAGVRRAITTHNADPYRRWLHHIVKASLGPIASTSVLARGVARSPAYAGTADRQAGHRKQILEWVMVLHGFLSSPTGGGVRHGLDLKAGVAVQINEARLYCNLIRTYITYLLEEHERLSS